MKANNFLFASYLTVCINFNESFFVVGNEEVFEKKKSLIHYQLDAFVPCGDGSPAGFYTDFNTSKSVTNPNHVINFMGGGACANKESCDAVLKQQPYMLSGILEPSATEGHTILSDDPEQNPEMASFTKWIVPYCSQDLYLGDSQESSGFLRSGSVHVKAFLNHWLSEVVKSGADIDTLVVAGVSAGTMAILNHFDEIQNTANAAGVQSLRLVMDSSLYSDNLDTDFTAFFEDMVNPLDHPLCFQEASDYLQHKTLSRMPCCLSTHCMLRHSGTLNNFATSSDPSRNTRLLLIDSAYDSLQTFIDFTSAFSLSNALPSNDLSSLTGTTSTLFNIGEFAGSRKQRVRETLFAGERKIGPNVIWATTTFPGHNVLIPSVELTSRLCQSGAQQQDESSCDGAQDCVFTSYPGGVYQVCNETGSGLNLPIGDLSLTLWTTIESWKRISVNSRSIEEIISQFVSNSTFSLENNYLSDSCPGPNCVSKGFSESNPAQSLIEVGNIFKSIPTWFKLFLTICLASIPLSYTLANIKLFDRFGKELRTSSDEEHVYVRGLSVTSDKGEKILDNIDLDLRHSTLNCLLGHSGCGKSTLFGVLSRQLRSNLDVEYQYGCDLSKIRTILMRQLDLVTMENMSPHSYLEITAKLFGCDEKRYRFVHDLVRDFFPLKCANPTTQESKEETVGLDPLEETVVLDPFHNAIIKECSGGQRRMLAIASTLFQNTNLLLLDEPLSGVDSVAGTKILEVLKKIVTERSITVFMTLHQPSDEILLDMDKVVVMGKGRIIFDGNFKNDEENPQDFVSSEDSPQNFIHDIIKTSNEKYEQLQSADNTMSDTSSISLNGFFDTKIIETLRAEENEEMDSSTDPAYVNQKIEDGNRCSLHSMKEIRRLQSFESGKRYEEKSLICSKWYLWQIQPLLRRLHLECPPATHDLVVLPSCYLAISLWGLLDPENPLQAFLITSTFTLVPSILFQTRLIMTWRMLEAHMWDLEDKRISCLSYQIASTIQMMFIPIISIIVSLTFAFATFGWDWSPFWNVNLFCIMLTIGTLQFGKTLCATLKSYQSVSGIYSIYIFLSLICSGFFVNPAKVPIYLRWVMYLSMTFYGVSGSQLSVMEYAKPSEDQCLSMVSCITSDPSFIANLSGFSSVTSVHQSIICLTVAVVLLAALEYIFLVKSTSQRANYKIHQGGNKWLSRWYFSRYS